MSINLDDISCLPHLPIKGEFWEPPTIVTKEDVSGIAIDMLGVLFEDAVVHLCACRGVTIILNEANHICSSSSCFYMELCYNILYDDDVGSLHYLQ